MYNVHLHRTYSVKTKWCQASQITYLLAKANKWFPIITNFAGNVVYHLEGEREGERERERETEKQ